MLSRIGLSTLTKRSLSPITFRPLLAATSVRTIKTIPQPPGYIVGTVNDAYVPPPPHKAEGSLHWTSERVVSIGLLPLVLAPFITGASTVIDSTMSALLLFHCFAGFQSCIIDYIPKRVYGGLHNAAIYLLTFGTGIAGYGVYQIEKNDGGVSNIISKIWAA
ncbi:Succinate dehydrogenase [ubiquinone] cytochrome b small subunit, mitochondrial [Candida viswanathii]|uniref:Succinate dehydrogenase [ubiquinone] cytochrome b small subunit n=1 Tax=Candida viswanathii TaxID=5486 RepID=A0A367XS98_9ASCO|nr:Succinate dehydrogenase [ubiquinone] cytochrome b small subunit, mitochondrial [Candida viswanathii]